MHYRRRRGLFSQRPESPPKMEMKKEVPGKKKKPNKFFKNVVLTSGIIGIIVIGMLIVQDHDADVNADSFLRSISADLGAESTSSSRKNSIDSIASVPVPVCFKWDDTTGADEWWTHNPRYEIYTENDQGFCFTPHSNVEKRDFMQGIYDSQFKGDCSSVFTKSMPSSGWGKDFSYTADGLWYAMQNNRPFQTALVGEGGAVPGVWHYAGLKDGSKPVCPTTDMYCYLLNITNCAATANKTDVFGEDRNFQMGAEFLKTEQFDWLVEYMTRMQSWLRKEVYDYFNSHITMTTPCSVFHVRRGDTKGHYGKKYHPIHHYATALGNHTHENVLLLTDSSLAIDEAHEAYPSLNWMHFNRTRFKANEGGWENHFPSNDPKFEVVLLQSIFKAVKICDSVARSHSNFATILIMEMEKVMGKGNVVVGEAVFQQTKKKKKRNK